MNGTMTQRAWKIPTLNHASHALVPLALIAVMMALPALPGGFSLVALPSAPHALTMTNPLEMLSSPATAITVPHVSMSPVPTGGFPASVFRASTFASAARTASATGAFAPTPLQGSDSSNFEVTGSDCAGLAPLFGGNVFPISFAGSSIASPPGENTTIDVAGATMGPLFNGAGGTDCTTPSLQESLVSGGLTSAFRSTDGGQSWTNVSIPINVTHWNTSSDPNYGSINWGTPSIAAGPNNVVMVANTYINGICYYNYLTSSTGCTNSTGLQGNWGIAVSTSTNGGVTYNPAEQLNSWEGLKWVNMGSCAAPDATGFYYYRIAETPSIAINPSSGLAIATWDVFMAQPDPATCTDNGLAVAQYSISTDNGVTWSTPANLSGNLSEDAVVAVGPAPTYSLTAMFEDYGNATAAGISEETSQSTNNGTTWSTPKDIITDTVTQSNAAQAPDAFFAPTLFKIAADTSPTSPYKGHEYGVWSDDQAGGSYAGYGEIRLVTSSNSGATWGSSAVALTPETTGSSFVEPSVAVEPNGAVWVTFYSVSTSTGNYNLMGMISTDGGTTWGPSFAITDEASSPGSSVYDIGSTTGLVATTNGLYPSWTDCRNADCDSNGDVTLFVANSHDVTITTNATGVTATITTAGVASSVNLPATLGWDNSSAHSVTVPQYVPDSANHADVWGFVGYSGINTSSSFSTTFNYAPPGSLLNVTYTPVPAATIQGMFTPAVSSSSLKLNGAVVPLTPFNSTTDQYSIALASGIAYTFTASASKYQTQMVTVFTSHGGGVYYQNYSLVKADGSFKGFLTPYNATLEINGSALTNVSTVNGAFNVAEPWGWYWVNATDPGTTSFSEYLEVNAGLITTVDITLFGGWIAGTINLGGKTVPGLVLKIDNSPVSVAVPSYTFNASVLGGFHTVTATAPGWNLSKLTDIYVTPGSAKTLTINLTNRGWISGSVGPSTALAHMTLHVTTGTGTSATGNYYPVTASSSGLGVFNVSLLGSAAGTNYTVNLSASGYTSFQQVFSVTPGNATAVSATLSATVPGGGCKTDCGTNCTQTNTCPPPSGGGGSGSSFPTTDVLIIVAVIVLAAIVAAVFIMRGRSGGGKEQADYDEGPDTYQDSATSSIPKLQPDGSMGGPPPPTQ